MQATNRIEEAFRNGKQIDAALKRAALYAKKSNAESAIAVAGRKKPVQPGKTFK